MMTFAATIGRGRCAVALVAGVLLAGMAAAPARAEALLDEAVGFTGQVLFLQLKVPGLVIGAVRNGERSVHGFGQRSDTDKRPPDGDTLFRIGSITKAFTGQVLAQMAAKGTVALSQPLTKTAPDLKAGQPIRLIDLVTHSAGLPRELSRKPGPPDNPMATITRAGFAAWLKKAPLLFKPGTAVLYSNFGFDLLSFGLAGAAKKPYPDLLREYVTGPLGLKDTTFAPTPAQKKRLMQGHNFDGSPMPVIPTGSVIVGSGGLYSTANDLLRWMAWHLDRRGAKDAEARLLDHAPYLVRDGLTSVVGMDESGHMDAMALAWVVMMPKGDRPLILQKAGGLQGVFSYIAFSPKRNIAVVVAINKFDFGSALTMAEAVNELIATLAPR
jgi:D-alanyl-D-alanine-carboxypeptidase/D-alanyl-D-alanine-endopeptidase